MQVCHVRCLGLVPYQQAWDLQAQLATQLAAGEIPPTLLLLEHPHTVTFGRTGKPSNLLWSDSELTEHGVQVFWVDRGGDVTYHGPGQLVGYPIIPLNAAGLIHLPQQDVDLLPRADYISYLRQLEEVLILTLQQFGVAARTIPGLTGVWVNQAKIAAIGVKVDAHGITSHGFALNIAPDMAYWDGIIGCGLAGYAVTSMAELQTTPPSMQQVMQALIPSFEHIFGMKCLLVT